MKTVTFYSVRKLENKPFSLSLLEKEAFSHLICLYIFSGSYAPFPLKTVTVKPRVIERTHIDL